MQKQNEKRGKRVKKLIAICAFSAVILVAATYAWFIGLQTVRVSSFDVNIATTEDLLLSLNGADWDTSVDISKSTLNDVSYSGHTNSWGGEGLIPMSTIGDMDTTASRMKLYEKASLTNTSGGYRLLASRIKNYNITTETVDGEEVSKVDPERKGYVAFDLFIKNSSGTQYIKELNEKDEEAIFLTNNSAVTVASDGVANTGIENSVRVAFAQIGRVIGTTATASTITGITCKSDTTTTGSGEDEVTTINDGGVTGICRTAQIWEPNDKAHEANAISWYDTSCLKRTGSDVTKIASYSGSCNTITNDATYRTYAVNKDISNGHNVDIYDGTDYNGYTGTTINGTCTGGSVPTSKEKCLSAYGIWTPAVMDGDTVTTPAKCEGFNKDYCDTIDGTYTETSGYLSAYPYFTDTMKFLTGTNRPQFMTLAPNSITKVRIYIYIEGQDIDNYDFASIGKKISVNFGFTKERLTDTDINYTGPGVCKDTTITFDSKSTCETAGGVWTTNGEGGTCAGNTKAYCTAAGGTWSIIEQ